MMSQNAKPSITRTLYIPIEIFDRELGGALLLAAAAVDRGWRAVLGGKQAVFTNMSRFNAMPGVFFLKSIVPGEVFKQKEIMADGHRIVSLDVEGLVPSNGESGVRLRYSEESIGLTDILFFWGRNHYDSVAAVYPQIRERSVVSGSPIIDEIMVRGRRSADARRNRTVKQILIGTSCGYANHINGIEFAKKMTRDAYRGNVGEKESRELEYEAMLDLKIFEYWKQLVPRIARECHGCEVVLRPHPSENKEFWRSYLADMDDVRIDAGGSIMEEMLKSDVYIHFNSTSSITSRLLGIPTFMPLPSMDKELADRVTFVKDISITVASMDELIGRVRDCLEGCKPVDPGMDISRYCENLKRENGDASGVILDSFERMYAFTSGWGALKRQAFGEWLIVRLKRLKFFLLWALGRGLSVFGVKTDRLPPANAYKSARGKQPDTGLRKVLHLARELLGPRACDAITVTKIDTNLFVVDAKEQV